ncbi:MAG: hypothetical protein LBR22_08485 [Desulfovibrio sp.]|jgi:hypothetical protein|nr:hypothetical protein [Desulfovibrio sp.]
MTVAPPIKVYGHISPVSDALWEELDRLCGPLGEGEEPVATREGDTIQLAFEGLHFPVEEVLEAVRRHLGPVHAGKLDVLDVENWRMTRHVIKDGKIETRAASLNDVLSYSGF